MKVIYDFLAALTFFTRFPVWKLVKIPSEAYKRMIYFWPLTGWVTASVTVGCWLVFSSIFPILLAVLLSFACRVLLTGGLHEDGLSDFFDGFGGGRTKEDVLRIMKDSHTGSFALIGMLLYYAILVVAISSLSTSFIPFALLIADPLSKFIGVILMNILPYARTVAESKSKTVFNKLSFLQLILAAVSGCLAFFVILDVCNWPIILVPVLVLGFLYTFSKIKIKGYTGDVCGATALLAELSLYLTFVAIKL